MWEPELVFQNFYLRAKVGVLVPVIPDWRQRNLCGNHWALGSGKERDPVLK